MKLKNRQFIFSLVSRNLLLFITLIFIVFVIDIPWNIYDFQVMDYFFSRTVATNEKIKRDERIVFLNITKETYESFSTNYLRRDKLAELNYLLSELNPNAVMYDIIFSHPSERRADSLFAESISYAGNVYLPVGFSLSQQKKNFRWDESRFSQRKSLGYLSKLKEYSRGFPFFGEWTETQNEIFMAHAKNTGHINAFADKDGIYRHINLIVKLDSLYFPSITLSMFLDYVEVPFDSVEIYWDEYVKIPKLSASFLDEEIRIPIDETGAVLIPFACDWKNSIKMMEMQSLVSYAQDEENYNVLTKYFEGGFIFISDIAVGTSDLGQTPLEPDAPLVILHGSLMNALLTNQFYHRINSNMLFTILFCVWLTITVSLFVKNNLLFYLTAPSLLIIIAFSSYKLFLDFTLMPTASILVIALVIIIGSLWNLQILTNKDQYFIKNAFAKYVPETVVDSLLANPEQLQLGGEERIVTIFFSDIENFTTLSESLPPAKLVHLINEYLTEMTTIILKNNGIIDKYIGDGILAEFGVPIYTEDHADRAAETALSITKKLFELNERWSRDFSTRINCRIGINTGRAIVGNMGSAQVFDYTVMGDVVNLASRLEGANKSYGTKILISEFVIPHLAKNKFKYRYLDRIVVKGKTTAVSLYELLGFINDEYPEDFEVYLNLFGKATELIAEKEYEESLRFFSEALKFKPDDQASQFLIQKINNIA